MVGDIDKAQAKVKIGTETEINKIIAKQHVVESKSATQPEDLISITGCASGKSSLSETHAITANAYTTHICFYGSDKKTHFNPEKLYRSKIFFCFNIKMHHRFF